MNVSPHRGSTCCSGVPFPFAPPRRNSQADGRKVSGEAGRRISGARGGPGIGRLLTRVSEYLTMQS
jgi:hypothetical protein